GGRGADRRSEPLPRRGAGPRRGAASRHRGGAGAQRRDRLTAEGDGECAGDRSRGAGRPPRGLHPRAAGRDLPPLHHRARPPGPAQAASLAERRARHLQRGTSPGASMNRWIGIALLAGSCLLAGCEQLFGEDEAAPVPAPTPPTVYALTVTRGAVHLERDGVRLLADLGMIDGDVLVTGPDGAAEVRLPDGRVLEVGPNARLKVDAAEAQLRIELGRGVILARGPAGGGKPDERLAVEVKTPLGLTRLGADAEVELDADSGTIEVRLGSVVFLDGEGSTLEAEAGEQIVADASGAATVRAAVSEEEMLMLTRMEVVLAPDQPGAEILRSGETRWTAAPKEG